MTESGRAINTTNNHPYLVKISGREILDHSDISKSSSSTINSLPLNSLTSAKSEDNASTSFLGLGGCITNNIIPENSFGGNIALLRKSESCETNTDFVSFDKETSLPFVIPFEAYSAENPSDSRNRFTALGIFSSSRNFGEFSISLSADKLSSIFESSRNMLPSDRWVVFQNIFNGLSSSYQFDNVTNQNSCAFESWLSMTNFTISNNILTNFDSHAINNDNTLFKTFD